MIIKDRDIDWELQEAGTSCSHLDKCPQCIYSINAFGKEKITAYSKPPEWFNDESKVKFWDIDPATIYIWPTVWRTGARYVPYTTTCRIHKC